MEELRGILDDLGEEARYGVSRVAFQLVSADLLDVAKLLRGAPTRI